MNMITKIGVGVVAVIGGVVATGFTLPDHVVVKREAMSKASPQAIIGLAASNAGYQTFNPYKAADPALKISPFGPASGVGSGFSFDGKDGKGTTTIVAHSPSRVDYQIKVEGMGEPTQAIQAIPTLGGTKVEWSMRMEFGNNPILRVMGLMMPSMMEPTLDQGLATLTKVAA